MSACAVCYLGTHAKRGSISWPNTDLVFDLADWGSKTPGTKVRTIPRHAHCCPANSCNSPFVLDRAHASQTRRTVPALALHPLRTRRRTRQRARSPQFSCRLSPGHH